MNGPDEPLRLAVRPIQRMHGSRLRFADFEFDALTGELSRDGAAVRLEPQPAALLALLAGRQGRLVTRDELARELWSGDTHVNFHDGLNYAVRRVRQALGDDARAPRFIETIPKRGYRFLPKVEKSEHGLLDTPNACSSGPPARDALPESDILVQWAPSVRSAWARGAGIARLGLLAGAMAAALFVLESRPNRHHELTVGVLRAIHRAVFSAPESPRPPSSAHPQ